MRRSPVEGLSSIVLYFCTAKGITARALNTVRYHSGRYVSRSRKVEGNKQTPNA
jgi:hypothetical protein